MILELRIFYLVHTTFRSPFYNFELFSILSPNFAVDWPSTISRNDEQSRQECNA